jgi:hypothetical protein
VSDFQVDLALAFWFLRGFAFPLLNLNAAGTVSLAKRKGLEEAKPAKILVRRRREQALRVMGVCFQFAASWSITA